MRTLVQAFISSGVAMGWAKSRGPPSERVPISSSRDNVIKRRRSKERVEWRRGPWRAVLAFLLRGPRVPSYATVYILPLRLLQFSAKRYAGHSSALAAVSTKRRRTTHH